jgi:hypothetical protein
MDSHSDLLSAANNIPLHCSICPRKPDFSDVSHLLTHVGSKGHLSNYFKMRVRASTDAACKKVVDDYDEWYEAWNVQDLIGERLRQKERKKGLVNGVGGSAARRSSAGQSTIDRKSCG